MRKRFTHIYIPWTEGFVEEKTTGEKEWRLKPRVDAGKFLRAVLAQPDMPAGKAVDPPTL